MPKKKIMTFFPRFCFHITKENKKHSRIFFSSCQTQMNKFIIWTFIETLTKTKQNKQIMTPMRHLAFSIFFLHWYFLYSVINFFLFFGPLLKKEIQKIQNPVCVLFFFVLSCFLASFFLSIWFQTSIYMKDKLVKNGILLFFQLNFILFLFVFVVSFSCSFDLILFYLLAFFLLSNDILMLCVRNDDDDGIPFRKWDILRVTKIREKKWHLFLILITNETNKANILFSLSFFLLFSFLVFLEMKQKKNICMEKMQFNPCVSKNTE